MNPRPARIDYGKTVGEVYAYDEKARVRFRARLLPNLTALPGLPVHMDPNALWGIVVMGRPNERVMQAQREFQARVQRILDGVVGPEPDVRLRWIN